jgi:hypothetical protein
MRHRRGAGLRRTLAAGLWLMVADGVVGNYATVDELNGPHLAVIEAASHLQLVFYISLLICLFAPKMRVFRFTC